jgi:hypothetical protein
MSLTSVVGAPGPTSSTPRGPTIDVDLPPALPGPAIDVSNFSGGRCQTCRQHPPGGLPSTTSTLVVAATGPAGSNP